MLSTFQSKAFEFGYLLDMCKSHKMDVSTIKKSKNKNHVIESQELINAEDELLCQVSGKNGVVFIKA